MGGLFGVLLSYPVVVFTALLGVALLYWLFVILGALDIDLFDADADGVIFESADAAEALEGAADGLDAAGDAADALDAGEGAADVLNIINLRRAPITVTFSIIVFFGWVLSYMGVTYLAPLMPMLPSWATSTAVLLVSLLLSLPLASLATKPLERVFKSLTGKTRKDFIGATCRIRTGRVDGKFGQAEVADGGAGLIIPVRIDTSGVDIKRGDRALIIDYDAEREAYIIEAYDAVLAKTDSLEKQARKEDP